MSKNQENSGCLWIIVLVLFLGYLIGPPEVSTNDVNRYNSRDSLSNSLKDPSSLEIIEERQIGDKTYFKYRAKNSFGGTTIEEGIY